MIRCSLTRIKSQDDSFIEELTKRFISNMKKFPDNFGFMILGCNEWIGDKRFKMDFSNDRTQ